MKVLLLNPPDTHTARISRGFNVSIGTTGLFPPLGLLALAAWVRRDARFSVAVLDAIGAQLDLAAIEARLVDMQPDVIGLGAFTYTFYDVLQVARLVRRVVPQARIVVGGPHTQLFARETLAHPEFDVLVLGDGEEPFMALLDAWARGKPVPRIPGLAFRSGDEVVVGRLAVFKNLDQLPIPAYDLVDADLYRSTFGRGGRTLTVASSRGCPFQCTFCQVLDRHYRAHSLDYLLNLVRWGIANGYRNFYFFDDLFNITAARVEKFAAALLAEKLQIHWVFRGRVDQVTERMCRLARQSGCVQFILGVEAHTDADLLAIKKRITMAQVRAAVRRARRHGLETSTNWIIGLPTHRSTADLDDMIDTVIRLRPDYAMFTILQLLPGCEMYDEAVREGQVDPEAWSRFVRDPVPHYQIPFYDRTITAGDQERYYRLMHERFYRRPAYILRRLLRLRSLDELRNKARAGLAILGVK